jgi:hypothetical protein
MAHTATLESDSRLRVGPAIVKTEEQVEDTLMVHL